MKDRNLKRQNTKYLYKSNKHKTSSNNKTNRKQMKMKNKTKTLQRNLFCFGQCLLGLGSVLKYD